MYIAGAFSWMFYQLHFQSFLVSVFSLLASFGLLLVLFGEWFCLLASFALLLVLFDWFSICWHLCLVFSALSICTGRVKIFDFLVAGLSGKEIAFSLLVVV